MEEKYNLKKKLKFIDIMILIVLVATIGLGLWLLFGSPTEMQAIIALSMFVGTSGIMLLKYVFNVDKKSTVSFVKVREELKYIKEKIKNIDNKLDKIDKKIK